MFATLNLQIASPGTALEGALDLSGVATGGRKVSGDTPLPFAALLALRTDVPAEPLAPGGEFLPPDGKGLPPFGPPKLADDLRDIPEIEVAIPYMPTGVDKMPAAPVALTPVRELPVVPTQSAELSPKVATQPVSDKVTDRALQRPIEPGLLLAQTRQAISAATPGTTTATEVPVVQPLAENLLRDKASQLSSTAAKPVVIEADSGTIKLTDAPRVEVPRTDVLRTEVPKAGLTPVIGQALPAIETVQRPDSRVTPGATAHSTTAVHLPTTTSQFHSDVAATRSEMPTDLINTPVRDAAWGEKLGERLVMLSGNQLKTAEIKLTPAELGPLRVRVSIEEGAAHVQFHAQHAVTREAIEQALPRLREMLAENGLSLGQTDVSEQGVADGKADREFVADENSAAPGEQQDDDIETETSERRKIVSRNNLLDTFA